MDESEIFRANLLAAIQARGLTAAELSRKAGLNLRAVKDIEERRTVSPKLSTAFALARALGEDPGEMMGLGPRVRLRSDLTEYLSQYDEADQERLLRALAALPSAPPGKP
jgi:transcriptional regulator with XRE-family HTH domain